MIASSLLATLLTLAPLSDGEPQDGLIVDRGRLDRRQTLPDQTTQVATAAETATGDQDIAPFRLQTMTVEANAFVRPLVERAAAPFVGQTLDAEGVARLRAAVSAALAQHAALPIIAVDTTEAPAGALKITAVPGRVGRIAIYGDIEPDVELMRRYAGRLASEAPLTRETSERYFSLISDIPGAKTTLVTAPSATAGATDLGLEVDFTRWVFESSLDNRGSNTLGRTQFTGAVSLNGGFRMGDQTRLAITLPTGDPERFQYVTAAHRQPIGSDGAVVTLSAGHLRTRVEGLEGDATNLGLIASWPLIRSYRRNLVLSGGIDALDSDNAVFGNLRATEQTRALRGSAAFGRLWPKGTLNASLTLSQGIDGLGAEVDALTDADFAKVNGRIDAARAVGRTWRLSASLAVQYSEDRAPTAELFSLGGADFGRGFGSGLLVGDSGYGAKAEAAWRPAFTPTALQGSEAYVFADGGEVRVNARDVFPERSESLMSAGVGVRLALGRRLLVEVEGARAVDDPRPSGARSRLGFAVTARF